MTDLFRSTPEFSIDLGTTQSIIFKKNRGLIVREPTMIAYDIKSETILGQGQGALALLEKRSKRVKVVSGFSQGMIADASCMFQLFRSWKRTLELSFIDEYIFPNACVVVPLCLDEVHAHALQTLMTDVGLNPKFIGSITALALSVGHDPFDPIARLILDMGGGKIDIGIISGGIIIKKETLLSGGNTLDQLLSGYLFTRYGIDVSSYSCMQLRHMWGGFFSNMKQKHAVTGKDSKSGKLMTTQITALELEQVIAPFFDTIIYKLQEFLSETEPAVIQDISSTGILLGGGLSQIGGIAEWFTKHMDIPVAVIQQAETAAVTGCTTFFTKPSLLAHMQYY